MPRRGHNQFGYTLVELVLVIALSAVFLIIVFQNIRTSNASQQYISSIGKLKSVIHEAQNSGWSGQASSSNVAGFLCGTRLRINSDGSYQEWRIYGSQDSGAGGVITYQLITGSASGLTGEPFAAGNLSVEVQAGTGLNDVQVGKNADGTYAITSVPEVDLVFLGSSQVSPIGQGYVYLPSQISLEAAGGSTGSGNCSDFSSQQAADGSNLYNLFLNIYGGTTSNLASSHVATMVVTTATGSIRSSVLR